MEFELLFLLLIAHPLSWVVLLASFVCSCVRVGFDDDYFPAVIFGVGFTFACWWAGVPFLKWIEGNWVVLAACGVMFFLIGIAWAWAKWRWYCIERRREFFKMKHNFLVGVCEISENQCDDLTPIPTAKISAWQSKLYSYEFPPKAQKHIGKISKWIAYWFPSFVNWVVVDAMRHIFVGLAERLVKTLQKVSDRQFRDAQQFLSMQAPPDDTV